jgi:hypothetical protein
LVTAAARRHTPGSPTFAKHNGWQVRPALKVLQNPSLCAYVMSLLPEPRELIFHLRQVDQVLRVAPEGTDLMMGYPPTPGATNEEYFLLGSSWPDQGGNQPAIVYPAGVSDDELEGGRALH